MAKKYRTVHQLCRATNGFTKKPSVRQKIDMARKRHESYRNQVADYDKAEVIINEDGTHKEVIVKASEHKWGIFYKKGYRALDIFKTKEEAEERLSQSKRPDLYDIREIEWFEEDKDLD